VLSYFSNAPDIYFSKQLSGKRLPRVSGFIMKRIGMAAHVRGGGMLVVVSGAQDQRGVDATAQEDADMTDTVGEVAENSGRSLVWLGKLKRLKLFRS